MLAFKPKRHLILMMSHCTIFPQQKKQTKGIDDQLALLFHFSGQINVNACFDEFFSYTAEISKCYPNNNAARFTSSFSNVTVSLHP
jgi:hypothetical protein